MPSGYTTTSALADSIPTIIDGARIVSEYLGEMPRLVDRYTLGENEGLTWDEISLSKLTTSSITETTLLDNPRNLLRI